MFASGSCIRLLKQVCWEKGPATRPTLFENLEGPQEPGANQWQMYGAALSPGTGEQMDACDCMQDEDATARMYWRLGKAGTGDMGSDDDQSRWFRPMSLEMRA